MSFFRYGDRSRGGMGYGAQEWPASITDLFNGFNRIAGDSYTGGPTTVLDNTGALLTAPVDRMGITGGRFANNVWLPTAADGSQLWPSQSVWTRRGSVAKYSNAYLGMLNEPARTNKVTCRKHNPVDITNLTLVGGDGSTLLEVVDATAVLTTAKLNGVCTNGKVYKLTAGGAVTRLNFAGATGNTNPHSASIYWWGSGDAELTLSTVTPASVAVPAVPTLRTFANLTPATAAVMLSIRANIGAVVYFILPQLEEGVFITSTILGDTLAAVTRPATSYTRPTAGVLRANDWGIWGRVVPAPNQTDLVSYVGWSSQLDATNYVRNVAYGGKPIFRKYAAGTPYEVNCGVTPTAGIAYEYQMFQSSLLGMGIRLKVDGGAWSAWVTKTDVDGRRDAVIGNTYQVGGQPAALNLAGNYPFTMPIMHADPKAELERLAARYP